MHRHTYPIKPLPTTKTPVPSLQQHNMPLSKIQRPRARAPQTPHILYNLPALLFCVFILRN